MSFDLASALKDVPNSDTGRKQIEYIRLDLIDADELNFYALGEIEKLASNIATIGLQQPLVLRPSNKAPGRYITVSGHRRRAALQLLVKDEPERWMEIPCIVDPDAVSPALQELKLIFGNADTRKMSNADLDQQAQRVEALLYQLKKEGYNFPGRMRDHVAEAVGASKSKLARLKVIRENLDPVWVDAWKEGTIGESVAYNLSQMPKSWQTIIHKVWGGKPKSLYADTVSNAKDRFQKVTKIQCQHGLTLCEHTVTMMEKNCKEMYYAPCTGCCFDCTSLQTCKNCCPQAESKKKELKAIAKKAQFDAKREQGERDRPGAEFARMVWQRIGLARERSGASIESIVRARGEGCYHESCDDPKQKKMETGEGDYSPNSTLSFGPGINARDMMKVVAVADALKCSVDYLLGRTDDRESHLSNALPQNPVPDSGTNPKPQENVSDSGTFWQIGDPKVEGKYILLVRYAVGAPTVLERWDWDEENGWQDGSTLLDEDMVEIVGWIPMPKVMEAPKPACNEYCMTGMSPTGHCGAAACCDNEYACCLQCPETCNSRCGWIDDVAEEI